MEINMGSSYTPPIAENPPNIGQPSNQPNPAQPSGPQIQPTQTSIPSYAYPKNAHPQETHIPHTIPIPNQPIHHQPQITNPRLDRNPAISPFHFHKTLEESQPNYSEEHFQFREKLQILEERLRAIEGSSYGIGEAADLCLVPDVIVPPKLKVSDFDKYKGITCPKSHLIMYYRKMASHAHDDKLLIHFFQDSLIGGALSWYMHLERTRIRSWKDLANAFLKQYKYNINMALNRLQLQNMLKKEDETFKEYAQRWREVVAQVEPPLSEKEMVAMFIDTLQSPFYDKMIGSVSSNFSNIVIIGERVEGRIRSGKIFHNSGGPSNLKKFTNGPRRKKEGETNVITFHPREVPFIRPNPNPSPQSYQPRPYQPAPPTFPIAPPMRPPQHWNQNPNLNQIRPQNNQERKQVQCDPIPMSYTELIPHLFQSSLVVPCPMKPVELPYPRGYNPNAKCEYHVGSIGHSTENCRALKFKVQDLINAKWLNFKEDNPNIRSNPLLKHGRPSVNAIREESAHVLKRKVEDVTTPLKVIFVELCKADLIKGFVHEENMCHLHPNAYHSIEDCEEFKHVLQTLMEKHLVQIEHPKEKNEVLTVDEQSLTFPKPLVIHYTKCVDTPTTHGTRPITIQVPASFPYKDNKAVPWKYDVRVYVDNFKENQTQGVNSNTLVVLNIAGVGGMTRSGRIYTPEELRKERTKEIERSLKGKAKLGEFEDANKEKIPDIKKTVSDEEACEFLKFIRQSEYEVVEQLNRTPTGISLLSLLLKSEPHRRTLLKVLNEAHVSHDITTDKFGGIIGNIVSNNYLTFANDEVPAEGMGHNKALHISVKCQDHIIARVFIDNGSSLNVMPKATLSKLPCDGLHMKPSAIIIRAFDGTRREVHSVGVVPSTLYQKLKFIIDNKLVIVSGEEDVLVNKPSSTPYIEAAEEALDTSFQALKITNATYVGEGALIVKPQLSNTSIMTTKVMLEEVINMDLGFRLGYIPTKADKKRVIVEKKERRLVRLEGREPKTEGVPICDLLKSFYSAGFEFQDSVAAADVDIPEEEVVDLVRTCPPNIEVGNWEIIELPVIFNAYSKSESDMSESNSANTSSTNFNCPINQAIEDDSDVDLSSEFLRLVDQEVKEIQPHDEPTETINLGTENDKREIKIGILMKKQECDKLIKLLHDYSDVFAWSYQDMSGLDVDIVEHKLPLKPECFPIKQKLRRMKPEMSLKIREEVKKQFDTVPKKDGKVQMCVDYRDLNRASPKEDFPLPHIDMLVDNTAQHSFFSFMDGYSSYNQIKIAKEDMEKTTFITPWGTFCYKVMPFGSKNAEATYQKAMMTLFHDMIHKEVEVYMDDMIAKSMTEEDHVVNLHKLFERLRKFKLRLNPAKFTFGVKSGKLLGFIVS
ncbi:uncharacterized protein LOC113874309 [Abrus precatorius]|uniref:Uncharacterized protein LOC113874309 n=1 Tax=Abrus precatorius TaxID=3816 RepID=A0A8B8MIE2_ABRPR|nr:uncharacterized protein LOC113874309 [Abrus precatorius]